MGEILINVFVASVIYNLCFGHVRTWLYFERETVTPTGRPMQIEGIDVPANIRDQYQYFPDTKMDRLMAQKLSPPRWSLEKGIQDYVRGYLAKEDPYL